MNKGIILFIILLIIIYIIIKGENIKLLYYSLVKTHNTFEQVPFKKRKIAIITAENRNNGYIEYHDLNCKKYSNINNYDYFRLDNCDPSESSTYWCKIFKVKKFLETNKYDYVMWLDSDTIFTSDTPIDYFISKIGEPDIIIGKDHNGYLFNLFHVYNAGIFLIKNSEIGNSFINECISTIQKSHNCIVDGKEQGPWAGMCYEQGVMNLLLREKYNNNYYIDNDSEFIINIPNITTNNMPGLSLVTHLPGFSNEKRENIFKDYV